MAQGKNFLYHPFIGKQKLFYYERMVFFNNDGYKMKEIRENPEYDKDNEDETMFTKVSYNHLINDNIIFGRINLVMIMNNGNFIMAEVRK